MNVGKTVFAQILEHIPRYEFDKFVKKYEGNHRVRRFSCYLTNIFTVPAITVANIYKQHWQVELFFRWIKQHLRIKTFYGISPNAVKTQIWIAVSIYLLVAILKKRLHLSGNLHAILQILEVNIFEKRPIIQIVKEAYKQKPEPMISNQLNLFNS